MEFFLCVTPAPQRTNLPHGAHLTSNGMGGITPILLRGFGNSQDYYETKLGTLTNCVIDNQDYEDLPGNGMNWSSFFDTSSKYMWTTLSAV